MNVEKKKERVYDEYILIHDLFKVRLSPLKWCELRSNLKHVPLNIARATVTEEDTFFRSWSCLLKSGFTTFIARDIDAQSQNVMYREYL